MNWSEILKYVVAGGPVLLGALGAMFKGQSSSIRKAMREDVELLDKLPTEGGARNEMLALIESHASKLRLQSTATRDVGAGTAAGFCSGAAAAGGIALLTLNFWLWTGLAVLCFTFALIFAIMLFDFLQLKVRPTPEEKATTAQEKRDRRAALQQAKQRAAEEKQAAKVRANEEKASQTGG